MKEKEFEELINNGFNPKNIVVGSAVHGYISRVIRSKKE